MTDPVLDLVKENAELRAKVAELEKENKRKDAVIGRCANAGNGYPTSVQEVAQYARDNRYPTEDK